MRLQAFPPVFAVYSVFPVVFCSVGVHLGISGRNDEKRISQEKYQEKYKRQDLQVNELIAGIGTDL